MLNKIKPIAQQVMRWMRLIMAKLYLVWKLQKHNVPFLVVTCLFVMSFFIGIVSFVNVGRLFFGAVFGTEKFLDGHIPTTGFFSVALAIGIIAIGWLLSTRTRFYTKKRMRGFSFTLSLLSVMGMLLWYGESRFYLYVVPIFEMILSNYTGTFSEMDAMNEMVLDLAYTQRQPLYVMLMLVPVIFVGFIFYFFLVKYHAYELEIKKAFKQFKWRGKWLQRFEWLEETDYQPHILLGYDVKTNEMVRLFGFDRTLNSIIVGAIGSGKSAALALPALNADFGHMVKFINEYPDISLREDYISKDVSGKYLNGISVIDPSNDLCKDVYQLAKAHGIAEEAITYIDPTNENTPSFNPMRGPTDKVAEVFAEVISGLSSDTGMDFFAQAQRNHLKQFIYLLKEHDPNEDVTFDMLIDMYDRPEYAHELHMKLKRRMPSKITREAFKTRDEYNYWEIIKGIDAWFDVTIVELKDRAGIIQVDKETGNPIYVDAEAEYVKGLRNTLKDLASNILIRRVLFGKSDFDFDRHLAIGGVLLVNTAKGELSALSRVLGKIVLLNLQNAAFRREPRVSPYHHIVVDESPEYLYPQFKSFPTQSRKYKIVLTVIMQTLAQLEDEFGETYKNTLLAAMRQKMFYGDATGKDALAFSEIVGESLVFKEGESEMESSAIQEDPSNRSNASYQRSVETNMTANDLIYLEAFQCAVKLVENNTPIPVRIIRANFVPEHLMKRAKIQAKASALAVWLEGRRRFGMKYQTSIETLKPIEETERERIEVLEELGLLTEDERNLLDVEQIRPSVEMVKYQTAAMPNLPRAAEPVVQAQTIVQERPPAAPVAPKVPVASKAPVAEPIAKAIPQAPTTVVKRTAEDVLPTIDLDNLFAPYPSAPPQAETVQVPVQQEGAAGKAAQAQNDALADFMQPFGATAPNHYEESRVSVAEEESLKEIFKND